MTPFGRQPVTAGLLATQALAEAPAPDTRPDKWALLRDLTTARQVFHVSDRDLAVLAGLLSFHPTKELIDDEKLIVFPSNATLSSRVHGMPESTLRRHLAALVRAGLILRRDSPNGKRYATREISGEIDRVFGFDLRPLLVQCNVIGQAAEEARAAELALRRLREAVVIRLRDASKLIAWGCEHHEADWESLTTRAANIQRGLRRKLDVENLENLKAEADELLTTVQQIVQLKAREMHGNDVQNERHYQNSKTYDSESELCKEKQERKPDDPTIPLALVLKATPEICIYSSDEIRTWRDLVSTAYHVRPMLGISPDAWKQACEIMGPEVAAVTLACILQRAHMINRPGGYLRALTDKAETTEFSPAPMVMALLRAENSCAI